MSASWRYLLVTVVAIFAACAASFCVSYAMSNQAEVRRAARSGDAMNWLRLEFHLDAQQYVAIQQLHEQYSAVCAEHCTAITAAKKRNASSAEIASLEKACVDSMTTHFRQVAALMPRGEGDRYLAMVLPRVKDYDHSGVPNVRATP